MWCMNRINSCLLTILEQVSAVLREDIQMPRIFSMVCKTWHGRFLPSFSSSYSIIIFLDLVTLVFFLSFFLLFPTIGTFHKVFTPVEWASLISSWLTATHLFKITTQESLPCMDAHSLHVISLWYAHLTELLYVVKIQTCVCVSSLMIVISMRRDTMFAAFTLLLLVFLTTILQQLVHFMSWVFHKYLNE